MLKTNKLSVILEVTILSLTFITSPISYAEDPPKVKVGVILPLTGAFARYGMKIQEGISQYKSKDIEFIFEDEGCDPKVAVSAYTKLSDIDGVKLFLGPWCGSPQSAVAPRLKNKKQIAILGSSAPENLFDVSGGWMFSTQHSIEAESTFLAKKVSELGGKDVLIIFRENQFSRTHEAAFRAAFTGKIIDTLAYNSDDLSELKAIALRVKSTHPDALYIPDAFPLMAGLLKEISAIGVKGIKVYSVYSAQSDDVLKVVGKEGEGMVYSYPDIGDEEAFHRFPALASQILTDAIKECGEKSECIRSKLIMSKKFDSHGVLTGGLILKTIKDGKFVEYSKN